MEKLFFVCYILYLLFTNVCFINGNQFKKLCKYKEYFGETRN